MVRNQTAKLAQDIGSNSNKFFIERLVSGQKTICVATDLRFDVLDIQ